VAEAEWGTTEAFTAAVTTWAVRHGHPVWRVVTPDPQAFAERAADVILQWRRSQGLGRPRTLVESFIQTHPWHVLRTGTIPFWTVFPVQRCADAAAAYLAAHGSARIDVVLFNHGVKSTGLAGIDRWRQLTKMGDERGQLIGVHPHRYPSDFSSLARTANALRRLPDGPPWSPLPIDQLAHLADSESAHLSRSETSNYPRETTDRVTPSKQEFGP